MKKIIGIAMIALLAACAAKKTSPTTAGPKLYEVLTEQENGGANIAFNEIVSDQKEMAMLAGDENLSGKVRPEDFRNSTFLILNLGEKSTGGYGIGVEKVEEFPDKIVVTVKEKRPEPGSMVTQALTYPYAVVKINSKKPIEVK
jgi:hypothetical protein